MADRTQSITLDYEATGPVDRYQRRLVSLLRSARIVTVPAVFASVWYVAVTFRTMGDGPAWPARLLMCVMMAAILGLVPAAVAWLGLPLRRYLLAVAVTALLPTVVAESYASVEEHLFVSSCRGLPPTAPTFFKDRWWPNRAHYLYYEPTSGEFGGGD